jgi:probable phosphoglycerate mutase
VIRLARHGETDWNRIGRYQGRLESDLSELGLRQADALAAHLAALPAAERPARIVSSPLRRCRATAEPAARTLGLGIEIDDRLTEIDHGDWNGRMRDEIAASDPARYGAWRSDPARVAFTGGESLAEVDRRWRAFAAELASRPGNVLIVTHDAVLRVALLAATGRSLDGFWTVRAENGAFALLEVRDGALRLTAESVTDHLGDARAAIAGQAL